MKNILATLMLAACIVVFATSGNAERLSFSEPADPPGGGDEPLATVLSISPDGSLEAFSGTELAPFIPMQFDQFAISLIDVNAGTDDVEGGATSSLPRIQLNTGIKTESYLKDPKTLLMDELLGSDSDSLQFSSSVIFVGVGFDFNSIYLKGNAYVGRPLETISGKLPGAKSPDYADQKSVNTDAYGYEASAGYQISNMIALGAGFGKMTDKNKETDQTEEVYAVYAQAILAVAPGMQVKPEVGKVDRIKEESNADDEIDQSFYAGAIWEINF